MMNRYEWVKKVSLSGNTYYVPEPTLPVINYAFLHTVFYLFTTEENAKSGESEGATGFVLATESELHNDLPYLYAVTNAHCIEYLEDMGAKEVFLRFNTKDNTTDIIAVPLDMWKKHPKGDDLAVLPLEPSSQWRLVFVTDNKLLAVEHLVKHNIGVGDETITIGRYVKHGGKQLNLPAARFGHISALPLEKIYQEDRDFPQESFLVETHSISGFSGSPVFIQIEPDSRKAQEPISETTTFLLGVDWGHFDFKGELIDPKSQKVKVPSGMMCVVPAWKLAELLYSEELTLQRKELDKEVAKKKGSGASLDAAFSREEFEKTLRKVSRKVKPKDKNKK